MIPPPPTSTLFPYTTLFRSLFERPPVVAPLQEEPVRGVRAVDRMPQHHEELRGRQHRRDPRRALLAVEVLRRDLADRSVPAGSLRRGEETLVPLDPSVEVAVEEPHFFSPCGE